MYVLAGPNGAGKSTLYEVRIRPSTRAPFINADEIRRQRAHQGDELDAYQAARLAAAKRSQYLRERQSFVTETVFSHESKLDLIHEARAAEFRVVIYHVNVSGPDISVARVRWRASQGGHEVPEDKIRARYARNKYFIREAVALADLAQIFDSSKAAAPPRWILTYRHGRLDSWTEEIPSWASTLYEL